MASEKKHQNISIQPSKVARSSVQLQSFVLSNEGLTDDEINRKSTSDRRKRRIAHVPKFPLPVIKKPVPLEEKPDIRKQKVPKQKKYKEEKIEQGNSKKDQNLANQNSKIKKLKSSIASTPWAYSEAKHGRTTAEKRKSVDSVSESNHKRPRNQFIELVFK